MTLFVPIKVLCNVCGHTIFMTQRYPLFKRLHQNATWERYVCVCVWGGGGGGVIPSLI